MRRVILGISGALVALLVSGDQGPSRATRVADPVALLPRLGRVIAAREYEATPNAEGLQAPNRAQGLRTYFDSSGIRVLDRMAAASAPELARLTLDGVGRGDALEETVPGEVSHDAARVEIRRPGLTEWYVNAPAGLEQGFAVGTRPEGAGALTLELAISGAEISLTDGQVFLRSSSGRRLSYSDLRAEDAGGRKLPSHFALSGASRVRLVVDDSGASYPLAIDPLLTQVPDTSLTGTVGVGGNTLGSEFGVNVAAAGDVNGDGYGDLIVGAPLYDGSTAFEGAAFVFLGGPNGIASGGTVSAAARLESLQAGARFGWSVASAGDVNGDGYADVIVGAFEYDAFPTDEGAAFIFLGGPGGISNGTPLTAATVLRGNQAHDSGTNVGGWFGIAVSSAGDVNGDGYDDVLVGAPYYSDTSVGEAFIFLGSPSGVASAIATGAATRLTLGAGKSAGLSFGLSVSSAGDVNGDGYDDVIIGAYQYETAVGPSDGGAFIFLGSASGIANATTDTAATKVVCVTPNGSASPGPEFGASVASAGDVNGDGYGDVVVGAGTYGASATPAGAVFVFLGGVSGVASGSELSAASTIVGAVANEGFGGIVSGLAPNLVYGAVAGAGDVNGDGYSDVLVSQYGSGGYVYLGSATGVASGTSLSAAVTLPSFSPSNGLFGLSSAGAGDVNGDGYDDVVIGDPLYLTTANAGGAFVYLGGAGITSASAAAASHSISSAVPGANLGQAVASAGDVNGDGYPDVIVGAPSYDAGAFAEGAAFVFHGGPAGVSAASTADAATMIHSGQESANLGQGVASAGDVDGDGYSDVIVGAALYSAPENQEGAAFVFRGGPSGVTSATPATAYATFQSNQVNSRFGYSVASADVNGDGRSDVIIGAPFYNTSFNFEGAVFVYLAGPTGLASGTPATASATIRANQAGAALGNSVASAGDVNGDGFEDIVVGAPLFDSNLGAVGIFRGSATGITGGTLSTASTLIEGIGPDGLGWSVAGARDVNGDGFDDVIAGSPLVGSQTGGAFVFAGGAAMPATESTGASLIKITNADGLDTRLGTNVAGVGDVNADGFADVAVSAVPPDASVWIFYGGSPPSSNRVASAADRRIDSDVTSGNANLAVIAAGIGDVNGDGVADLVVGSPTTAATPNGGFAYLFYGWNQPGRSVQPRQLLGDGSGIGVRPGADSLGNGFGVRMLATHPAGRGRVRGEVQACPAASPFGAIGCTDLLSPAWVAVTPAAPSASLAVAIPAPVTAVRMHWRARILYADATQPLPTHPEHGPWRRQFGLALGTDIRTSGTSPDSDFDTIADAADNCRYRANAGQGDTGGFGSASPPDGIGDACQCGNITGVNGRVDAADVLAYRQSLATGLPFTGAPATFCRVYSGGTACNILQVSVLRRALHVPALAPLTTPIAAQVCLAALP
jgi:hypothetical protein